MHGSIKFFTALSLLMLVCTGGALAKTVITVGDTELYALDLEGKTQITEVGLVNGEIIAGINLKNTNPPDFTDSFEGQSDEWVGISGEWIVQNGKMKQISTTASRSIVKYSGGELWKDYDFSAEVQSPSPTPDNTNGIIFRADDNMQNMYVYRIYSNTHLEFAKWENGQFSSILKWEYTTQPDTIYNLRVLAKGEAFQFFIDGINVNEISDDSYSQGTIGLYTFKQTGVFDSIRVYMDSPDRSIDVTLVTTVFYGGIIESIKFNDYNVGAGVEVFMPSDPHMVEDPQGRVFKVFIWTADLMPIKPVVEFGPAKGGIYYVSPNGNDHANGSYETPWKSMARGAKVSAGSVVVFEDGEYNETGVVQFTYTGLKNSPIILRSRNRHGAKIVFPESTVNMAKLRIVQGRNFITIDGFEITQNTIADGRTSDILVQCMGNDCNIINNKIHNAFEEGIKAVYGYNILIADNEVYNMNHEGIDVFNVSNSVVRGNIITDTGRVGLMVKGGARNIVVYDNIIRAETRAIGTAGITVGGVSNNVNSYDIKKDTGFELYNSIFYNNVVISGTPGLIASGISYYGARDSHCYNNIIVGARWGVTLREPAGISNGWEWNPPNANPVLKNNIILNCTAGAYNLIHQPKNLISEYNLFYNTPNPPQETGGVYQDPQFENVYHDWRLSSTSPAIDAGAYIPSIFPGFWGRSITVEFNDYSKRPRILPWDMGIYDR